MAKKHSRRYNGSAVIGSIQPKSGSLQEKKIEEIAEKIMEKYEVVFRRLSKT